MSSISSKNLRLECVGEVAQGQWQASMHSTASTTYPQAIPEHKHENSPGDSVEDPQSPIKIIEHPRIIDDGKSEASSPQPVSSPNGDGLDEKAQQIRVIVPKTEPNPSVDDMATATTKEGTPTFSTPKSLLFSPFTAEKLRLRTSPLDPSSQIAQWGIDWSQPSRMLGLFIVGLTGMICHHVYNSWWDGRLVGDPQWTQRVGSAFSFFAKMCMVSAANIAYKQLVWLTIKKRDYTITTLDGIFSICNDPFRYLNFELLLKATIPAVMAAAVWCLPLCAIVSPSTLTSVSGVRETPSNCTAIPTVNFQNENGVNVNSLYIQGEGMSFFDLDPNDNFTFYYDKPSMSLEKIERLALLSSSPLTLPNPCEGGANCTWEFSFAGPSYDCQEKEEFDNSTGLTKDMLAPTGGNIYYSVSTGSEDEYGRPNFWLTETWKNDSDIGTFFVEPTLWIGFVYNTTEFISWDDNWPYLLVPNVIECTLYNTTYNYNMSFTDGIMNVNSLERTLIAPALPPGSSIAPTNPNYESFSAYHAAGYLFRNTLSNNITQSTGQGPDGYATTFSEVAQTSLIDPDTSFAVPDFPTKVEQQFSNIILSLAAYPSFYSQVNVTGPCTITAAVLKWDYQPFWLVLSYALATGVTLIAVGIGLYAFRANGYSADTSFSTFLTTTRNPSLDRLSEGYCLGQTPLPKDYMKLRLRFGEIEGFNGAYGDGLAQDKEHVAFGLVHETRDIVFGKKYA